MVGLEVAVRLSSGLSAAVVLGVGVLAAVIASPTLRNEVAHQASLSFTHRPEPFTALYFADSAESGKPAGTAVTDFVVENHEGRAAHHSYAVTLRATGRAPVVRHGAIEVAEDGQVRRQVQLGPAPASVGYSVTVELDGGSETIRRWVAREPANGGMK